MKSPSFSILIFLCILNLGFHLACKDIIEEQCNGACDYFVKCVEEARNIQLNPNDRSSGKIQCVQGCTMIQGDILRCYEEEPDSCDGFRECILQSGALE